MNIHKYARLTPHGREILVHRILKEGPRVPEHRRGGGDRVALGSHEPLGGEQVGLPLHGHVERADAPEEAVPRDRDGRGRTRTESPSGASASACRTPERVMPDGYNDRAPNVGIFDMRAEKSFDQPGGANMALLFDSFNLTNGATVLNYRRFPEAATTRSSRSSTRGSSGGRPDRVLIRS